MSNPSVAFVCCIEPGGLEEQTLRLVESIRKWGGAYSNCEIRVIQPRSGPAISKRTKRQLQANDVLYSKHQSDRMSWYTFANKPRSLVIASEQSTQDILVWIDSDIIMTRSPEALLLPSNIDIAGVMGDPPCESTGPDDINQPYWDACFRAIGLDSSAIPKTISAYSGTEINYFMHGGIFSFRRTTGFADIYYHSCEILFRHKIASKVAGIYFNEMVSVALAALKMNLRTLELPITYNYNLNPKSPDDFQPDLAKGSYILHYHGGLWPNHFDQTIEWIKQAERHDVAEWLSQKGPIRPHVNPGKRLLGKYLRTRRKKIQTDI